MAGDRFGALLLYGFQGHKDTTPVPTPIDCVNPANQLLVPSSDGCDICAVATLSEAKAAKGAKKAKTSKSKLQSITFRWTGARDTVVTVTKGRVYAGSMPKEVGKMKKKQKTSSLILSTSDTVTVYNNKMLPNNLKLDVGGWSVLGQLGAGYWTSCNVNGKQPMRVGDMLRAPAGILEVIGFETNLGVTHTSCTSSTMTSPAATSTPDGATTAMVSTGIGFISNTAGCDVCTAAAVVTTRTGKAAKAAKVSKQGKVGLQSLVFTWSGKAQPTITASGKCKIAWKGSDATIRAHGRGSLKQLVFTVDGHTLVGQPDGHGYEATCNLPMHIGDVLHSPTGTLTLIDFIAHSGSTKQQCVAAEATAIPTVPAAAKSSGISAGCDMCIGGAANPAPGSKTGQKSGVDRFTSITFAWSGATGTTMKVHKAKTSVTVFRNNEENVQVYTKGQLPLRLHIEVGGHRMEGQDGKHGYLTSCKEPMRVGDMLTGPLGTLTVVGFQTVSGQNEAACITFFSGRLGKKETAGDQGAAIGEANGKHGKENTSKTTKGTKAKGSNRLRVEEEKKNTNVAKKNAAGATAAGATNDAAPALPPAMLVVISVGSTIIVLLTVLVVILVKNRSGAASRYGFFA